MKGGIGAIARSRKLRLLSRSTLTIFGAFGFACGIGIQVAPAGATPIPPSTSVCDYSNAATPSNPNAVLSVKPGSTITIACAAGSFPASSHILLVEASGLAAIVSPASANLGEVDSAAIGSATAGTHGSLSTTFKVPAAFKATDPNAVCPPTRPQINAGLTCELVLVSGTTLAPLNFAQLLYAGQKQPNKPTLRATARSLNGKATITVSEVRGACPTPPTAKSHCWWGAPVTGTPSTAFGGIPAPEALLASNGFQVTSGTLAVSPAVYCAKGATAKACKGRKAGTLIPPALRGKVTTRRSFFHFIDVEEPNATPYTGNGILHSLIPITLNVSASAPVR
jgi:hypothetical protein